MPVEWSGLAPELLLALDRHSGDPLHSQLQERLREAIRSGVVSPCGTSPAQRTAGSSTPDLFRWRKSSLPRGSLSLSGSLIAAGLVDRLSLILHPSLAGGSGAGTYPRDGAIRPPSLRAGSMWANALKWPHPDAACG